MVRMQQPEKGNAPEVAATGALRVKTQPFKEGFDMNATPAEQNTLLLEGSYEAESLIARQIPAIALLDLRLPDGDSAPLALRLVQEGCTVALISGADSGVIPASLGAVPRFPKPTGAWQLADWVDGLRR